MLLSETKLQQSEIDGLGVFAVQLISIGTCVWEYDPTVDVIMDRGTVLNLPEPAREHIRKHALTLGDGNYQLGMDNNQYVNHSNNPNLIWAPDYNQFIAGRNIEAGEELTKDYRTFSKSHFAQSIG
jgi:SET domain-containing protein